MKPSTKEQAVIRQDIFHWLNKQENEEGIFEFKREYLRNKYTYEDMPLALMDRQNGIWNPDGFDTTLSITRTLKSPYIETRDGDTLRYSYERLNSRLNLNGRNKKLQAAAIANDPLIFFQEVFPTLYVPIYPVYITKDDPLAGFIEVNIGSNHHAILASWPRATSNDQPRYEDRMVKSRLHQKLFRTRVLHAYGATCAVCGIAEPQLLDAAHITPDVEAGSTTSVANGLALCKIHHAAYDQNLLEIDGESRIHIRKDLMRKKCGPMLRYAFQAMDNNKLRLPIRASDKPDPNRLDDRYKRLRDPKLHID